MIPMILWEGGALQQGNILIIMDYKMDLISYEPRECILYLRLFRR